MKDLFPILDAEPGQNIDTVRRENMETPTGLNVLHEIMMGMQSLLNRCLARRNGDATTC